MTDSLKQALDLAIVDELLKVLEKFRASHPITSATINIQVEDARVTVKAAMSRALDPACSLVGGVIALAEHIQDRKAEMAFRKPYLTALD